MELLFHTRTLSNWMVKSSHIELYKVTTAADIAAVKRLFLEYLEFVHDYLGQSLAFQDTQKEFATFPDIYDALLIAKVDGEPAGACGIKPFNASQCELKRLYCRRKFRGLRLGTHLTQAAINHAKSLAYQTMLLDTDPGLIHANFIYESLGFRDIAKYYDNPLDESRYMALDLTL